MKESKYNLKVNINNDNCVYNSLTKAFIKQEAFNFIDTDSEVKETMYNNGFLVDDNFNELASLRYLYQQDYFNKDQLTIIITPTWDCNLNCPYCLEKSSNYVKQNENYFEILNKFSEKHFKNYKFIHLSLFGGEPLLYTKQLFDYLDKVHDLKLKYGFDYSLSVTTNGTLINTQILEKLSYHNCSALQITLDGNKQLHDRSRVFKKDNSGSFDLLIKNIKLCVKTLSDKCNLIVRFNLNNIKAEELTDTLKLFNSNERSKITLLFRLIFNTKKYCLSNHTTVNELKSFYDLAEKLNYKLHKTNYSYKPCEAGGNSNLFYLLPDLSLWKCINDLAVKEANIGYIDETGTLHLNSTNLMLWYEASDWTRDPKCNKCKMTPDCLGGCIIYKVKHHIRQCRDFNMFSLPNLYE